MRHNAGPFTKNIKGGIEKYLRKISVVLREGVAVYPFFDFVDVSEAAPGLYQTALGFGGSRVRGFMREMREVRAVDLSRVEWPSRGEGRVNHPVCVVAMLQKRIEYFGLGAQFVTYLPAGESGVAHIACECGPKAGQVVVVDPTIRGGLLAWLSVSKYICDEDLLISMGNHGNILVLGSDMIAGHEEQEDRVMALVRRVKDSVVTAANRRLQLQVG